MEEMNQIKNDIDEQQLNSIRNFLRFHKVPIPSATQQNSIKTDSIVLDIVNSQMNMSPPLTLDEIDKPSAFTRFQYPLQLSRILSKQTT